MQDETLKSARSRETRCNVRCGQDAKDCQGRNNNEVNSLRCLTFWDSKFCGFRLGAPGLRSGSERVEFRTP